MPPVAAKTGTLTTRWRWRACSTPAARPRHRRAPLPEPILFAVFLNHDLRDRGAQRREIADLLRQWRRLAGGSP